MCLSWPNLVDVNEYATINQLDYMYILKVRSSLHSFGCLFTFSLNEIGLWLSVAVKMIAWKDRLWNDLLRVDWDLRRYLIIGLLILSYLIDYASILIRNQAYAV